MDPCDCGNRNIPSLISLSVPLPHSQLITLYASRSRETRGIGIRTIYSEETDKSYEETSVSEKNH